MSIIESTLQRVAISWFFCCCCIKFFKKIHQARLTLSAEFVSVFACSSWKTNTQIYCPSKWSVLSFCWVNHGVLTCQEGPFPKKVKLPNNPMNSNKWPDHSRWEKWALCLELPFRRRQLMVLLAASHLEPHISYRMCCQVCLFLPFLNPPLPTSPVHYKITLLEA